MGNGSGCWTKFSDCPSFLSSAVRRSRLAIGRSAACCFWHLLSSPIFFLSGCSSCRYDQYEPRQKQTSEDSLYRLSGLINQSEHAWSNYVIYIHFFIISASHWPGRHIIQCESSVVKPAPIRRVPSPLISILESHARHRSSSPLPLQTHIKQTKPRPIVNLSWPFQDCLRVVARHPPIDRKHDALHKR